MTAKHKLAKIERKAAALLRREVYFHRWRMVWVGFNSLVASNSGFDVFWRMYSDCFHPTKGVRGRVQLLFGILRETSQ